VFGHCSSDTTRKGKEMTGMKKERVEHKGSSIYVNWGFKEVTKLERGKKGSHRGQRIGPCAERKKKAKTTKDIQIMASK